MLRPGSRSCSSTRSTLSLGLSALAILALLGGACSTAESGKGAADPRRLTLDRLYSLPHLIGTAPARFAWSPDSSRVAFLWNDEGMGFRDVWVVPAARPDARPVRWTRLPQVESDAADQDPVSAAEARARRERDPGAVEVLWHPDGERLLVSFRGDLWLVREGEQPKRALENARQPAFSADGTHLAFLRRGDLWLATGEGASERRLTKLASDGVRTASFRWSPDLSARRRPHSMPTVQPSSRAAASACLCWARSAGPASCP